MEPVMLFAVCDDRKDSLKQEVSCIFEKDCESQSLNVQSYRIPTK